MMRFQYLMLAVIAWMVASPTVRAGNSALSDSLQIVNVTFHEAGTRIVVTYDLIPSKTGTKPPSAAGTMVARNGGFRIIVLLKREANASFTYVPRYIRGDVGGGIAEGTGKQIVWDVTKEFPEGLEGNDYYFIVLAEPSLRQSNLWLWIGGGAAAIGGIVAAVLTSHTGGGATPRAQFPAPPGHP